MRLTGLLTLALACAACGETATITRADGTELEGRIVRSDAEHVVVQPRSMFEHLEPDDPDAPPPPPSAPISVARRLIDDVDHPGNGALAGGAVILAMGLVILSASVQFDADEPGAYLYPAGLILAGGGLIWHGADTYGRSSAAFAPPEPVRAARRQPARRQFGVTLRF